MKIRLVAGASVAALSVSAAMVPALPAANPLEIALAGNPSPTTTLDRGKLKSTLDAVHRAGIPGVYAEVRAGGEVWRDASGVADLGTGRPVTPDMRQRVGSITKTFTAAAIMQLAERGRLELDAPIGRYLPQLVPGERGHKITVRMLLNHTSGIPEYLPYAFPSLQSFPSDTSPKSLDDNRFRQFDKGELIKMGLTAPATGEPGGATGVYSNTNYLLLGEILEQVTGTPAETYITRNIIARAGLRNTEFPTGARIKGPHPRMYEALYGLIEPPRDYSVYNMSWVSTGAALVSTVEDVNRFYGMLFSGTIVERQSLAQMQRTIPVRTQDGHQMIDYGLGLQRFTIAGCGSFWGHDGTVWGAQTMSLTSADGKRRMSVAMNLARWNELDSAGQPQHHSIDAALSNLYRQAMCGRL